MTQARRVFLAHAREDKERVRALYKQIKQRGFSPWLDEEDLIAGQIWAVRKRGFVQAEFRLALVAYGEMPPGAIYFKGLSL